MSRQGGADTFLTSVPDAGRHSNASVPRPNIVTPGHGSRSHSRLDHHHENFKSRPVRRASAGPSKLQPLSETLAAQHSLPSLTERNLEDLTKTSEMLRRSTTAISQGSRAGSRAGSRMGSRASSRGHPRLPPMLPRPASDTSSVLERMTEFDLDDDGKINFQEFRKACAAFGKYMSSSKMKQMFAELDADGSGNIDFAEFIKSDLWSWETAEGPVKASLHPKVVSGINAAKPRQEQEVTQEMALAFAKAKMHGNKDATSDNILKAFQFYDTNKDGTLSREEFTAALRHMHINPKPKLVDQLLTKFDEDGDGKVDYIHFMECLMPKKAVLKAIGF